MVTTMAQVMTRDPQTVSASDTVGQAARRMRDADTTDVVVIDQGRVLGILTDRDITLRVVAEEKDPSTPVGEICRGQTLVTIRPDAGIEQGLALMRDTPTGRLLVAEADRIVGVVSLADLTAWRDIQGRRRPQPDPSTE